MAVTVANHPRTVDLLALEEQEAWSEYLKTVEGQPDLRYEELEPWAWKRLRAKLLAIQTRRTAIVEDDGA